MRGTIRSIPKSPTGLANYAFIRSEDGKEYFLHATGLKNDWDELKTTLVKRKIVEIEFVVNQTPRGTRAENAFIVEDEDGS